MNVSSAADCVTVELSRPVDIAPMSPRASLLRASVLVAAACLSTGCYRGSLVTGLRPSRDVREVTWTRPFSVSDASLPELKEASGCPAGVARVETTRTMFSQIGNLLDGSANPGVRLTITCAEPPVVDLASDSVSAPHQVVPDTSHSRDDRSGARTR